MTKTLRSSQINRWLLHRESFFFFCMIGSNTKSYMYMHNPQKCSNQINTFSNSCEYLALNIYGFLKTNRVLIKKSLWETPFFMCTNEIYIKFKYTRSNFFVQRIYLRLKFSVEMNGCTYTRLRSVKGLLLTSRSEQEKGNNGWHLTGVHCILFYTFLYKWQ